jgi:hypothetical protein
MMLHPEDLTAIKEIVREIVKEEIAKADKSEKVDLSAKKGDK